MGFNKPKNKELEMELIIREDIDKFLKEYLSFVPEQLTTILKCFQNEDIEYFSDSCGYKKSLLKLVIWIMHSNGIHVTREGINKYFWKINRLRLENSCERIINLWIEEIDKIEIDITKTITEASKNYLKCFVCKENQVSILYLPCGHLIICTNCHKPNMKSCQICITYIDEFYNIYL